MLANDWWVACVSFRRFKCLSYEVVPKGLLGNYLPGWTMRVLCERTPVMITPNEGGLDLVGQAQPPAARRRPDQ
jgi:hypothetical protein